MLLYFFVQASIVDQKKEPQLRLFSILIPNKIICFWAFNSAEQHHILVDFL